MSISDDFKLIDDEVDKILNMSEKAVVKEYATVLETLRTTIRKLYDKYEVEGKLTLTEMSKYERLLQMEKDVEESISKLYKENSSLMKGTLSNIFVLTTNETFDSLDKAVSGKAEAKSLIPLKKTLSIDRTVNEKMAGLHWSERLGKHRIDVIYSVNKTLKEGLAKVSTYKELSDRLKNELEGSVVQPMRIIRTEGGRVYAKAQEESLDKIASAGVKMTKTWKTSADERVRSKHRAMEGVTIPYEDEFVLPDGKRTKMPRLSGYAEHDIHCRCFVTIEIVKAEEKKEDYVKEQSLKYTQEKADKDIKVSLIKGEKKGIFKKTNSIINLQLFANRDTEKQTVKQLVKGIGSYNKQIDKHEWKTKNPHLVYSEWDSFSEDRKNREIRHWNDEIAAFRKNIDDNKAELEKRGERYERD